MNKNDIICKVPLKFAEATPPRFVIMDGGSKEVMRISLEGVTVNPEVPMDEAAKYVIEALDLHIKTVIKSERNRIANACAQLPFGDTAHSFAVWIREQ